MVREKSAALVVNTKSRRGQAMYREVRRLLEARGISIATSVPVRDPARVPDAVARCVGEGHPLVIVGGGDGSISAVTDHFAGKPVALGILPLGTANSFARTIGVPLDLAGAVDIAVAGKVVDVDLGRIDGRTFANAAAIGLQPEIARAVPHSLKKVAGRAGHLLIAAGMLTRLKPFRCTITFDDGRTETFSEAMEVRIANGGYKGGMLVAPEADPENGYLVIHVVRGRSVLRLSKIWAQLAVGIAPPSDQLVALRGTSFTVEAVPDHAVSVDGEVVARTPITVGIARQALCVMAPHGRTDLT